MNTNKLKNATQSQLLDIWCALALINERNKIYNFLSYSEKRQLEIQRKQVTSLFKYNNKYDN